MKTSSQKEEKLRRLLELHAIDQDIRQAEGELRRLRQELMASEEGLAGLTGGLERVDQELERIRLEARHMERAANEKRDHLHRLKAKVNQVRNEKQYGAATLEFDLVKQDLRKLEDQVIDKLQAVEDLEGRRNQIAEELEGARSQAGPQRQDIDARRQELEERVTVLRDRRENLAIRMDHDLLAMYDRIRAGRSEVVLAPLTEEAACGYCYTSVTVQQEMQIREMSAIVCCEGCGVILYPRQLTG
jgi:predicted  nucleic acid-binding Zn-ribbon protein